MNATSLDTDQRVAAARRDVVDWRRHLHRHPELSFEEHETAAWLADRLAEMGHRDVEQPTPTSVVARVGAGRPGPVVALRADIDALPVTEETGAPFASTVPGRMHACGHDGHAAMLLGIARVLAGSLDLPGEVRLLFQHAEEVPPGGARDLVAAGVMKNVDAVLGCHLWSPLPLGRVAVPRGVCLAGSDTFELTVHGRGGHAGLPHEAADPIAAAAQIVTALQHVVSRSTDPLDSVVLSVTRMQAGSATNVIPDRATMSGTIRAFDAAQIVAARAAAERIVQNVAAAHGTRHELVFSSGYDPVVNDDRIATVVENAARSAVGPVGIAPWTPIMAIEDFSAYLRCAPGAYIFVGAGSEEAGATFPHHHPRFTIDERALEVGMRVMLGAALALLADGSCSGSEGGQE